MAEALTEAQVSLRAFGLRGAAGAVRFFFVVGTSFSVVVGSVVVVASVVSVVVGSVVSVLSVAVVRGRRS